MKYDPDQTNAETQLDLDHLLESAWAFLDRPPDVGTHQIFVAALEITNLRISAETPVGQMLVVLLLDRFLAVVRYEYLGKPVRCFDNLKRIADALRNSQGSFRVTGLVDVDR